MLILGGRYGSLEPNSGLSYTEIEYKYALELGKPCFTIVIEDKYLGLKIKDRTREVIELENPDKYRSFKSFVLSKVCRFFGSEGDIKLAVLESILDIQARQKLTGWVKYEDVPDTTAIFEELVNLRKRNTELEKQLVNSTANNKQVSIGYYTYEELFEVLSSKKITVPGKLTGTKDSRSSILDLFASNQKYFNIGISNSSSANATDSFLFYRVAPILLSFQLVEKVKVTGAVWQRIQTSKLGYKFLAEIEKRLSIKRKLSINKETYQQPK